MADPEISKRGGTDRMLYTSLYTLLTAHARMKLHAQCDSAGKRGGTCPLCPMLDPPLFWVEWEYRAIGTQMLVPKKLFALICNKASFNFS